MLTACAYCDILTGVAKGPPTAVVTDDHVAFIGHLQPTGPGYSLVVPKRHVPDLYAFKPDELGPMLAAVQRVSTAVVKAFGASGATVLQNNGEPGQRVKHVHFHVVPRRPGHGYRCESDDEVGIAELERQEELLRRQLR